MHLTVKEKDTGLLAAASAVRVVLAIPALSHELSGTAMAIFQRHHPIVDNSTVKMRWWDVHRGTAGIPGSHKANVGLPAHYRELDDYIDENVRPIGCRAGDCIIFTEALSRFLCPEPFDSF